jgi:UDP-N-acetylmuramoyl-tripeptide--D-alanyl-D-alanine ligase
MKLALENLAAMEAEQRFFIIGDMMEMGEDSRIEHKKALQLSQDLGLQGILIGKEFGALNQSIVPHFATNIEATEYLKKLDLKDNLILIKGSRGIKLEDVMPSL